jgi:hypothetical protein
MRVACAQRWSRHGLRRWRRGCRWRFGRARQRCKCYLCREWRGRRGAGAVCCRLCACASLCRRFGRRSWFRRDRRGRRRPRFHGRSRLSGFC